MPLRKLLILICVIAAPFSAKAGAVDEIRLGLLAQGVGGPGADREQGGAINLEALFNSPDFLAAIGGPRPVVGATLATDPDATSQIYAGLEWKAEFGDRFFVAGMLGGAIHNGETDFDPAVDTPRVGDTVFYGCRALFRLSADLGYRLTERIAASAHIAHISNAGLCDVNEGLDHVGLRLGYRF